MADATYVTRRLAIIIALGLAGVVATGGYALTAARGSTATITPLPHWGLYGDATWAKLQAGASAHGLRPSSIVIVTGTRLVRNRQSFAILRGRTTFGRSCFAVAAGTAITRLVCRVVSPVMVFSEPDTCAACDAGAKTPLKTLTVIALVRRDVQSVVSTYDSQRWNVERVNAAGGVSAFNMTAAHTGTTFMALGPSNRVLSTLHLQLARRSA